MQFVVVFVFSLFCIFISCIANIYIYLSFVSLSVVLTFVELLLVFSDIFVSPMWCEFSRSVPSHLKQLGESVKGSVLASKANRTVRCYLGGFKRWKKWCNVNGVHCLPADPFMVAVYLQWLMDSASSPSPILSAVYSLDWALALGGYQKVSAHPLVSSMCSAAQRLLGRPKCRKEPITAEMLQMLVDSSFKDKCASVLTLRSLALCLLGYAGFLRFSELSNLRACDVKISGSFCRLFLECSKTDQLREGAWVTIARSDLKTCPVKALEQYIAAAEIDLEDDLPLFRAIAPKNSSCKVRRQGISYTRVRELVKDAFRNFIDVSKIGVHSLRIGGASAAANAGIPDRLFKRHGRWSSENAKDGYIKDNMNSLLSVSKALGI